VRNPPKPAAIEAWHLQSTFSSSSLASLGQSPRRLSRATLPPFNTASQKVLLAAVN